jgi:outer membrane protein assembly factor BamB
LQIALNRRPGACEVIFNRGYANVIRQAIAIVFLLFLPAVALGQTKEAEEEKDKVSNDNPARPLMMPPASTEVKEAFDDFQRFQRRGAWERALKALYTIPDDQVGRLVDGENGFIIPVARKRRAVLTALSPEGQSAYRLFYDAEAQKIFDEAQGASELKSLERLFSAYFTTSIGDNAADRLGDLYFELGQFDRAADCWLAVLRERPDTDLSPALLSVKAALALSHAGRRSELEQVKNELSERYSDEKVTIGGQSGSPAELLGRLLGNDKNDGRGGLAHRSSAGTPRPSLRADLAAARPDLADSSRQQSSPIDPTWQVRFADSVEAGMTPPETIQWESNSLSVAVPAVAVAGSTLFANYLGHLFAVDLTTGKMLWRSASFHHIEVPAMQDFTRLIDTGRYAVAASDKYVWALSRDLKDPNQFAPFQLICRRADNGEVVWKSADLPEYAPYDLVGLPLVAEGKLFHAAKTNANPMQRQGPPQQFVLAIQPHDGKLLWKTEVGTFRQGQSFYWYYMRDPSPQPRLVQRAGATYLETNVGVLARLDSESGGLDWGYAYKTDSAQAGSRFIFFFSDMQQEPTADASQPLDSGEFFLVKGSQSDRLYAVDPSRMKAVWDRPITKSARLLGGDDRTVYLGGVELSAIDLATRRLLWATRVPGDSLQGRVLVQPDGLWQITPRGIFEIDPKTGDVRKMYRSTDKGVVSGNLLLTDDWLIAVSNRTISAYSRRAAAGRQTAGNTPTITKEKASP